MAYFFLLTSIRAVMLKGYTSSLPAEEREICADGIKYCVKNIRVAMLWARHVEKHGGGYHFMISSTFDTVVLLCTSLLKDVDNTMPKDHEVFEELDNALAFFTRLANTSSIAKLALGAASQVIPKLQRPAAPPQPQKRIRTEPGTLSAMATGQMGGTVAFASHYASEDTGSETSPAHAKDYSTPASMSDGGQESIESVMHAQPTKEEPMHGIPVAEESLSPWPIDDYQGIPTAGLVDTWQLGQDAPDTDILGDGAVQLEDFAALWDWEALGMGTYPIERNI